MLFRRESSMIQGIYKHVMNTRRNNGRVSYSFQVIEHPTPRSGRGEWNWPLYRKSRPKSLLLRFLRLWNLIIVAGGGSLTFRERERNAICPVVEYGLSVIINGYG